MLSRSLLVLLSLAFVPLTLWDSPVVLAQASRGAWGSEAPGDARSLGRIAQAITVRLEGATTGSGVLVGRSGRQYTVLTAWHVVRDNRRGEEIVVVTPEGRSRPVLAGSVRQLTGVDLAVLRFESEEELAVARLGRPEELELGSPLAVAGFPSAGTAEGVQPLRLKLGQLEAVSARDHAPVAQLFYSNETLPGMSGGPVLNRLGELVGIHGRAELHGEASRLGKTIATSTNIGLSIAPYRALVGAVDKGGAVPRPVFPVASATPWTPSPSPRPAAEPGLESLDRALAQGRLARADALTLELLLDDPGRQSWLTEESIGRLRCPLLLAIDASWTRQSRERFGFTPQRQLWPGDFAGFTALVGWRRAGFVSYARGDESDLPRGYYPRRVADGPIVQVLLERVGRCLAERPAESR